MSYKNRNRVFFSNINLAIEKHQIRISPEYCNVTNMYLHVFGEKGW